MFKGRTISILQSTPSMHCQHHMNHSPKQIQESSHFQLKHIFPSLHISHGIPLLPIYCLTATFSFKWKQDWTPVYHEKCSHTTWTHWACNHFKILSNALTKKWGSPVNPKRDETASKLHPTWETSFYFYYLNQSQPLQKL